MRAQGPTFWLLEGDLDWRTGGVDQVAVDGEIRLVVDPEGPLALTGPDGSLGGLTLPQGMAFDATELLYLLDSSNHRIKRFDPAGKGFLPLPAMGGRGSDPRQFLDPASIAIAGGDLYVADSGNRRIQVFAQSTLALRYLWGPWDEDLGPIEAGDDYAWEPVDVATAAGRAFILDRRYGQVLVHRPGSDGVRLLIGGSPDNAGRFSRIALDRELRIYLLDPVKPSLEVYSLEGDFLESRSDPGELLDRFAVPPIRLDHKDRFCLPETLTRDCPRELPSSPPSPQTPLAPCGSDQGGLLFDCFGNAVELPADPEVVGPRLYARKGTWISEGLDSDRHACQWHRIELDLAELPAGTKLRVSTYTENQDRSIEEIANPALLPGGLWETKQVVLGRPPADTGQGTLSTLVCDDEPTSRGGQTEEMLVQSHPGQYLWLRLELYGDGYVTPRVRAVRVHYPRESYLKYLPAVFAADDESRWFLERFLSIFQTEWDALEERIDNIARYFDPDAVPAGPCLDYLASQWLALPLEGAWDYAQKRRLLATAPKIYGRRGTAEGLRHYLRVYLANITGIDDLLADDEGKPEGAQAFPLLVEGFRKRAFLMLTRSRHAAPDKCELCLTVARDGNAADEIVGKFKAESEARKNACALLIIRMKSDSDKWIIAGLNGAGEFRTLVIDDPDHELSAELKKKPIDEGRIVELATSSLARTSSQQRSPLARLGRSHPLWSPAVVGRLQLDVFAQEGKVRLVSTGDPERDLFHEHAHRFQVFVPSVWVRTRTDEDLLRRALDTEKPAHTQFQLCLVEPRFRVGVQSTVGVDTILGAYPVAVLAGRDRSDVPENRPPRQRLGYDTVLGCGPGWRGGMPLRPGARVGVNTVLT